EGLDGEEHGTVRPPDHHAHLAVAVRFAYGVVEVVRYRRIDHQRLAETPGERVDLASGLGRELHSGEATATSARVCAAGHPAPRAGAPPPSSSGAPRAL